MKYQCAWCGKEIDHPGGTGEGPISHGICLDCARGVLDIPVESIQAYLERFTGPVMLVDDDVHIITANSEAYKILGKDRQKIDGCHGGEAIGCLYANYSGGCGNQLHCKTCTIRILVSDTLSTGRSHVRVPAYIDLHRFSGDTNVRFYITTEKAGPSVLLRIDAVEEGEE